MDLSTLIFIGIALVIWNTIKDKKESSSKDDDNWWGI